jgi:hypothetical protein
MTPTRFNSGMIEEAIAYVAVGFAATLAAMEAAWRLGKRNAPTPALAAKVQ